MSIPLCPFKIGNIIHFSNGNPENCFKVADLNTAFEHTKTSRGYKQAVHLGLYCESTNEKVSCSFLVGECLRDLYPVRHISLQRLKEGDILLFMGEEYAGPFGIKYLTPFICEIYDNIPDQKGLTVKDAFGHHRVYRYEDIVKSFCLLKTDSPSEILYKITDDSQMSAFLAQG